MNRYDITTNWNRSFYERYTELCEFLSMIIFMAIFIAFTFLAVSQLDTYCFEYYCGY